MDEAMSRIARLQPVPVIEWSQPRDNQIQIYVMSQGARTTWSVVYPIGVNIPIFDCPSVGFPLPADTQLTNPLKVYGSNGGVIEQAEPNGLYTSKNTDATYVICILPDGTRYPYYTEGKVNTWPFPVTVDYTTGRVTPSGQAPSMILTAGNTTPVTSPTPSLGTPTK
jgi:hypothetical protein